MKIVVLTILVLLNFVAVFPQADIAPLLDTQRAFENAATTRGIRSAFLEFLTDDSVIFTPTAVNGKQFWNIHDDDEASELVRNLTYADIASNGLVGYTTGNWRLFKKGKTEGLARFGQYVTIWERKQDGTFRAALDMTISHEKLPFYKTDKPVRGKPSRDINKRGWSPADASMGFLRSSMGSERLGGAYEKFAAKDVRLLRDGEPPIIGKKRVIDQMNSYRSIQFPTNVSLFQSADLAYTWNPCEFDNSNEGAIKGNCLHIWKLRNKKWWIVLGVIAPIPNETQPVLKNAK